MNNKPKIHSFFQLHEGLNVDIPFLISKKDMEIFQQLSGDTSRIHVDKQFAKKNNFKEPVVYGALIVARLSNLVGMHLPGDLGLATEWSINFNKPLYVNQKAIMHGIISHKSESTKTVKINFSVSVENEIIAKGIAGSKILND